MIGRGLVRCGALCSKFALSCNASNTRARAPKSKSVNAFSKYLTKIRSVKSNLKLFLK